MSDTRPHDDDPEGRLLKLVQSVLMRPEEERSAFLRQQIGDDQALQKNVMEMLDDFEQTESFLAEPQMERISLSQAPDGDASGAWSEFLDRIGQTRTVWERFRDEGEIARGGMGAIHKIRDEDLRRTLAMKRMLTHGDVSDPAWADASLGRFLEEAQVTSQLDHPGIVPVHEIGLDDQARVYFTMKLVQGEDLRAVFNRVRDPADNSWNTTRALSTLLRVCEAMAFAHHKGVIHRDLKPANVMVGAYGETYVMDWGIAKLMGQRDHRDLRIQQAAATAPVKSERRDAAHATPDSPLVTMDGDVVGTPAFMSPEQASGHIEEMGPHSDVYAVGAMLYHLLTGQIPYAHRGDRISPHALLANVQQGPPQPVHQLNREVPAELVAICDKAMARAISDRFSDMTQLANDLRAYLERRVVAAYESGPLAELKKWVTRNKALATTAAAALATVLVLSGWALFERQTAITEKVRADQNAGSAQDNADLAGRRAEEAEAEREKAEAEKRRVLRLSDVKLLSDLKAQMNNLWPAHPDKLKAMEQWLQNAKAIVSNLPAHEQTLADLRSRGTPIAHPRQEELADLNRQAAELATSLGTSEDADALPLLKRSAASLAERIGALASTVERERPHDFSNSQDAWWHDTLVSLVSGLVAFTADNPYAETIKSVQDRLTFASTIRNFSITYYQGEWDEAIRSIADMHECPQYGGLELKPQLGLVPIGRDPSSGLWEFWHVETGEQPQRNEPGRLVLTQEMGLVFVLIPGGTFWMGAQATDPGRANHDLQAGPDESPVHEVTLDAYFLSKYELTQGQWQRFMGSNPSFYTAGDQSSRTSMTLLHPVEQVSFEDCVELLGRLGLSLPTEAQWEHGCRAGSSTVFATGDEIESLRDFANIADEGSKDAFSTGWNFEQAFADGHDVHAPIGSMKANRFGLHDMHGNVWEWCLDGYGGYSNATRSGDGRREVAGAPSRVYRGGAFSDLAFYARSAYRNGYTPSVRFSLLGARPARRLH